MNYHKYIDIDVINGRGTRCTLFVAGCEHKCPGCYNKSTWRAHSGHPFTEQIVEQIIHDLKDTRIKRRGLSLSGGDPLFPSNCPAIYSLCKAVKKACPDKDIWLWTGYMLEKLNQTQREILKHIDVLVDGPFKQELADAALEFRGSSNQRILEAPFG
ncbi:MAG TPA: anaerobic ribonucleotide reductase-activating protein [Opitutae bacterium]|nr:anaerobic ribonucleotide reductase-activating protein [Opitutae bacterium]